MGHRLTGAPTAMTPRRKQRRRKGGLVGHLGRLSESFTNPRSGGGSIDEVTRLIDPRGATLLEKVRVAEVGMERDDKGELIFAIEVAGKINTTQKEVNFLLLATPDAAALLVAQVIGLARHGRIGPEFEEALPNRLAEAVGK